MKKFIFFILFIFINANNTLYASYILKQDTKIGNTNSIEDRIYYRLTDIQMKITDTKVKFKENDNDYIFNIEQNLYNDNLRQNYLYVGINPEVALSSFENTTSFIFEGKIGTSLSNYNSRTYNDVRANLNGKDIARYFEEDTSSSTGATTHDEEKYCRMTFYLSNQFGYTLITKKDMDKTQHKVKISKTFTYNFEDGNVNHLYFKYLKLNMNIKYEIRINKNEFLNYRYLTTYIPEVFKENNTDLQFNERFNISNIGVPSIDLMPYVEEHTHDFKIKNIYKDYHELLCEGCEWKRKINHEYKDIYDGINNNLCVCGRHKYVFINIENNVDKNKYNKKLEPSDAFPSYDLEKKGVHLIKITEEVKNYNKDISNELTAEKIKINVYENELKLPSIVPNFSTKYTLYYDINKYKIVFNKKNNLGININNSLYMNNMTYYVNESKKLIKNKYLVEGYDFLGWCDDEKKLYDNSIKDIDKVKYIDEEEVSNITYENDNIINLYPIYRVVKFTVTFKNNINSNVQKKLTCDINSKEEFPNYNSYGLSANNYLFHGYYIDDKSVKSNTSGMIKYIKSDGKGNGGNIDVIARFSSKNSYDDYIDGPKINDDKDIIGDNGGDNSGENGGSSGNGNKSDTNETNIKETYETNETDETNEVNESNEYKDTIETTKDKDKLEDEEKDNDKDNIIDEENIDGDDGGNDLVDENYDIDDNINDENDNIISKIISNISNTISNIIKGIVSIVKRFLDVLGDILNNIIKSINKLLDDLNLSHIKIFIKDIFNQILKILGNIFSFISNIFNNILSLFNNIDASIMIVFSIIIAGSISLYYIILFLLYIIKRTQDKMNKNNLNN